MRVKSPYLLTTVQGIPIIIKCRDAKDFEKFSVKGSRNIGVAVARLNIDSGDWVNDGIDDFIADKINHVIGTENECWIRKEDAH
jgi:hypothetical protein